jgi:hypothetical protein
VDTRQASSQSSITPVPALNTAAVIIERVVTVATDGRCEPVRVTGDWQLTADQVPCSNCVGRGLRPLSGGVSPTQVVPARPTGRPGRPDR